jgi:hypothetical protein
LVEIASMSIGRIEHNLCFAREEVYAIGGYSDYYPESDSIVSCEKYSPYKKHWITIANCHISTHNTSLCVFDNNYIYKIGGKINTDEISNYIERYSINSDSWEVINYKLEDSQGIDKKFFSL